MSNPVKLSAQGPAGWMQTPNLDLETATLIDGQPRGADHVYFENPEHKLKAGIWRSNAYTEYYDSYPCDEFMYVLEGSVTLENETFSETYSQGDAFLLPKGFKGYWKQTQEMLKYYVIVG
jgi:uncharacterized cupin superfamily protein